jgi:hypothetical protein
LMKLAYRSSLAIAATPAPRPIDFPPTKPNVSLVMLKIKQFATALRVTCSCRVQAHDFAPLAGQGL